MSRQLHIVCLDVPFPADYGGAIDMMNRIRMFHQLGVQIHLHYFSYNDRGTPNELNRYCETISVYDRRTLREVFSFKTPYIVASRCNASLAEKLEADRHPILLEGIHCTGVLPEINYRDRKVVVRMHNEESRYYRELARAESNLGKKLFFLHESRLLHKYNRHLPKECMYACVSENDVKVLHDEYHLPQVNYLSTFPSWQNVISEEGQGNLCLYHGNLSVPENEKAALWLLSKVFSKVHLPFVVAGKKPSERLKKAAHLFQHTCLVADPSDSEMDDLVRKAHIHVLPCFNKQITGIRLKLLHVLFEGRHCVVNEPMVSGTGLESACHIGNSSAAFASIIYQLYHQPFTAEEVVLRKQLLGDTYNNEKNTRRLIQWLW
ncbi:MAG: glycosyltransferase [Chitinophagaceae bacterium]